jgi:hypothetical protein
MRPAALSAALALALPALAEAQEYEPFVTALYEVADPDHRRSVQGVIGIGLQPGDDTAYSVMLDGGAIFPVSVEGIPDARDLLRGCVFAKRGTLVGTPCPIDAVAVVGWREDSLLLILAELPYVGPPAPVN